MPLRPTVGHRLLWAFYTFLYLILPPLFNPAHRDVWQHSIQLTDALLNCQGHTAQKRGTTCVSDTKALLTLAGGSEGRGQLAVLRGQGSGWQWPLPEASVDKRRARR